MTLALLSVGRGRVLSDGLLEGVGEAIDKFATNGFGGFYNFGHKVSSGRILADQLRCDLCERR